MKHVTRYALLGGGWIALALGAIGLFLPILPTAPFVLVAAACFMRSSEHLHSWIVGHRVFGVHVRDYLAGRGLRRRSKAMALVALWSSVAASVALFLSAPVGVAVVSVALAVSLYILRLPTCEAE